jgi:CO/xanthine dehydrogenase Mo-binding subunit
MAKKSRGHARKFTIGDEEAVRVLVQKLGAQRGSRSVDEGRLLQALDRAAQQYKHSQRKVRQAFFHGLLTGYGVGLKRR